MSKIEEEAFDYMSNLTEDDAADPVEMVQKAFIKGANFAIQNQWVSVEDALPDHRHIVLVVCDMDNEPELRFTTAVYIDGKWEFPDEWYSDSTVLRWMPIPPLPEARKGDEK